MRALGFEPKKEEIKKMIADIDKDGSGEATVSSPRHKHCNALTALASSFLLRAQARSTSRSSYR